jgi:hypothetical protein
MYNSSFSPPLPYCPSSTVIPNSRENDAGIDKEGSLNQWPKVACRKRRRPEPR